MTITLPTWMVRMLLLGTFMVLGLLLGGSGEAQAHERPAPVVHGVADGPQRTAVFYSVRAEEDGSGTITRTVTRGGRVALVNVAMVDEGLLPWDCQSMGNGVCGPTAVANGVQGPQTVDLVMAQRPGMPHSVNLTLSTQRDGSVRVVAARVATDEDAEGEVV